MSATDKWTHEAMRPYQRFGSLDIKFYSCLIQRLPVAFDADGLAEDNKLEYRNLIGDSPFLFHVPTGGFI
jgi:hypothetical protein